MKILVYADVHGNLDALEQLQKTEDYRTADLRVFLGDAVGKCAFPNECLNAIFASGDVFLMGNHDDFCAYGLSSGRVWLEKKIEYVHFLQGKVSAENRAKLQTLPKNFCFEKFGKKFFFTHYVWEDEHYVASDPDNPNAPGEKTAKMFKSVDADFIFFGHIHRSVELEDGGKKLFCVGSLGVNKPCNHGEYMVVEVSEAGVKTELKSVFFDAEKVRKAILEEGSPRAEKYAKWFALNLKNSEKLLCASRDFLENFTLDFDVLAEKLNVIKDLILNTIGVKNDVAITFDNSSLFGKSASFSGSNISFNKTRIETLFSLKIDDLDEKNLQRMEKFYQKFPTLSAPTKHEKCLFEFMKRYKENGWERHFSSVGSFKTVKYELLDAVFHECHHAHQDVYENFLTSDQFPPDSGSQILIFSVLFNKMFREVKKTNLNFEYERDNITFSIEIDAIYASFEILQSVQSSFFSEDLIFKKFMKQRVSFPENFNSKTTAKQIFEDYERLKNIHTLHFGSSFAKMHAEILKHKEQLMSEMQRRYENLQKIEG